jgi:hypothetical protein
VAVGVVQRAGIAGVKPVFKDCFRVKLAGFVQDFFLQLFSKLVDVRTHFDLFERPVFAVAKRRLLLTRRRITTGFPAAAGGRPVAF